MISLRKLEQKDIPLMLEWMKDENINSNFQFNASTQNESTVKNFIEKANQTDNEYHFAIVDDQDQYLGTISLKNINQINKNAEYAVVLRNIAIGKGIYKKATDLILQFAFRDLKLEKIYLNVLSRNERAIHAYEKYGFKYEGEFRKHLFIHEKFEDIKWFSILLEEFNK